jgi:hypothetical protein
VSARQRKERARLLGDEGVQRRMRRKAAEARGSDALAGLIERRLSLRAEYKGKRYTASVKGRRIFPSVVVQISPPG